MRLDIFLTEKKMVKSRQTAQNLIKEGLVMVNGQIITKPAKDLSLAEINSSKFRIQILKQPTYVGRGGLKLEKALKEFSVKPLNMIALDVGSSTGGFTDCLLQAGAKKVYAVDVGTDQIAPSLRTDDRVIVMEKTDIRKIKNLPDKIDLAVIDVSFISLELILPAVKNLLKNTGQIIALIKPQFETKKSKKNKSGIVKNEEVRKKVLTNIEKYCQKINLKMLGIIASPILGGSGNKEYLAQLKK